ncbi:MAG: signal peptide peptidase SppA [Deltaproteobacteria bacterium]|nr:signal peptide peptidase SppA [Deltaproteobacteria bacterium]
MFSRRHPYLHFLLIFSTIVSVSAIVISLIVLTGIKYSTQNDISDAEEKVGVIEVKGYIADPQETIQDIRRYREDNSIKAIVLRIDSPGGGVGPSQEISREVQRTLQDKKVVASLGAVAASGGYYIASAASGIVANPGTITGSIGVIMGFTDIQGLLQKIGITPVVVKSGQYKDIGSPVRSMTDAEKTILQTFSDQVHRQFITAIAEGRHLEYDKVATVADGRILTGENAHELGLVDRLGNLEDAIAWAGEMGGITGKVSAVYAKDKKHTFIKRLAESSLNEILSQLSAYHLFAGYVL